MLYGLSMRQTADSFSFKDQRMAHFLVPFGRDDDFVGREDILEQINLKFKTQQRVALDGIGGVG